MWKISLVLLTFLCVGCKVPQVAFQYPPDPRVEKAWIQVLASYDVPEDLVTEIRIVDTYDPEVAAWVDPNDDPSVINIDRIYITEVSDLQLEGTRVHEMWHVNDLKVNKFGQDKKAFMEHRASVAEGRYLEWQVCLGRKE